MGAEWLLARGGTTYVGRLEETKAGPVSHFVALHACTLWKMWNYQVPTTTRQWTGTVPKDRCKETGTCRLSPSVAAHSHRSASGRHISHASFQMVQKRASTGQKRRHSWTAIPCRVLHLGHHDGRVSHGAPYPGQRLMPQSEGPHLSRLKAKRGSQDVQWASGVSFWGRALTIHLRAGEGITCLLSRISAGDVPPAPLPGCRVLAVFASSSASSFPMRSW